MNFPDRDRVGIIVFDNSVVTKNSWQHNFISSVTSLQEGSFVLLELNSGGFKAVLGMNADDQISLLKDTACAVRQKAKQNEVMIESFFGSNPRTHDHPFAGLN